VSFNFDDADVFSVIQTIFGDILRVNYVVDPQVKGRVTYRSVAPVPRENVLPLMEVILRMNGIAIVEDAGLYRIIPIADIPREPARLDFGRDPSQVQVTGKAMIQVVPIQYVTSTDVVKVLTPFASANAQIIDAPKSNHIIIIDTASNVKRLLSIIDVFDSEQLRKVRPQVYVYPVQNSKAKDVTNILNQIFLGGKSSGSVRSATVTKPATPGQPAQAQAQAQAPAETAAGPAGDLLVSDVTRIFADEISNAIIILATRGDYELIEETIKKIDTQPRQVVIEGLIALVTLTDNLSMGLAWSLKTDVNFSLKPFTNDFNLKGEMGSNAPAPDATGLSDSGFSFVATDASGIVRARLEALATESKAKVLAAPHVLVSDNREARIQVGQQVPLVTSSTNVTGTTDIQRTVQYKDIGIILKVKPQVNDSGLVALDITQEVSSLGTPITIGSDTAPTLNKTEATTNLVAQNGQTIIIGGLIRDDTTKEKTGIPFLSRIPLIGWLFGNWNDVDQRTELVILLTPRVIRTQADAAGVTNDYVNKYKGMDKDLQKRLDGPQDKQQ
jgi:general secretion pathway protein D